MWACRAWHKLSTELVLLSSCSSGQWDDCHTCIFRLASKGLSSRNTSKGRASQNILFKLLIFSEIPSTSYNNSLLHFTILLVTLWLLTSGSSLNFYIWPFVRTNLKNFHEFKYAKINVLMGSPQKDIVPSVCRNL